MKRVLAFFVFVSWCPAGVIVYTDRVAWEGALAMYRHRLNSITVYLRPAK